jgi:hypothetical protein
MGKTRVFTKAEMDEREMPWSCDGGTIISDKVIGTSRWAISHEIVFRLDDQPEGEAYVAGYRLAATEQQDERPWENESTITATVVRQVERLVKVWEPVEEPVPDAPPAAS